MNFVTFIPSFSIILLLSTLAVREVNSEEKSAVSSRKTADEKNFSAAKTLDADINAQEGKGEPCNMLQIDVFFLYCFIHFRGC